MDSFSNLEQYVVVKLRTFDHPLYRAFSRVIKQYFAYFVPIHMQNYYKRHIVLLLFLNICASNNS